MMAAAETGADPQKVMELLERGYTVFERAYSPEEVDSLRSRLEELWAALGKPAVFAHPPRRPAPEVELGPAGLIFHKLTTQFPDLAPRLYKRPIIETLRAVLGPGMRLELPAGVLSDANRPFFDWHTHVDGVDDSYQDFQSPRIFQRSQRVNHILYLDDVNDANGRLLVYPRRITDPTPPPFDMRAERWPGMVELEVPRGSVVVLEQCVWHAVLRKQSSGHRAFIGSFFASDEARTTPWADPALRDYRGDDELYRSLLPR